MKENLLYIFLLIGLITSSFSGCEEEDDCALGFCPSVDVLAKLSIGNDTMYVGDTLIVTLTIPDSLYEVVEGDTIWQQVESFSNRWGGYGMHKIDSDLPTQLDPDYKISPAYFIRGSKGSPTDFSEDYPYQNIAVYVFREAGTFFFSTYGDSQCKVNGTVRGMNIDFDVAEKHIEWLEPYILAHGGTVEQWREYDAQDLSNFFPFRVLEK